MSIWREKYKFYSNALIAIGVLSLFMTSGCSGKLTRGRASKDIDAMLKPHDVGPKKKHSPGGVPGFHLPEEDDVSPPYFTLDQHKEYGGLTEIGGHPRSPDSEEYLLRALKSLGYVEVREEDPKSIRPYGLLLNYPASRSISLTSKAGIFTQSDSSRTSSVGFHCYPQPDFHQCNVPPLLEKGLDYKVTGIVQDEAHAKVNILIPWKLTQFGTALKPFATTAAQNEEKFGTDSSYLLYPALYAWEHFLNAHPTSGESPATVLFQKFDDGWRIVDENGKSEKDFD